MTQRTFYGNPKGHVSKSVRPLVMRTNQILVEQGGHIGANTIVVEKTVDRTDRGDGDLNRVL